MTPSAMRNHLVRYSLAAASMLAPAVLLAQTQPAARPDTAAISLSGVLFANYQYRLRPPGSANRFDLERAYLTLRGPLGGRASFRITTDVFQQERDTVNRSWQVRAKYAYLQYDYLRGRSWNALARIGILHNVVIDHDESFWPRWISTVPVDRHGFFSSADAGLASQISLPGSRGEVYATLVNGPGFGSREIDRFKDYAARLTLTPLRSKPGSAWRSLAISGWAYTGALASRFAQGGAGQIGPIGSSLRRDRWGVLTAVSHPRVIASVQYARRMDESEAGANTTVSPRILRDSTGSVASGYAIVRPFAAVGTDAGRFAAFARWDRVTPNVDDGGNYDLRIAGLIWDLSRRASLSLDLQHQAVDSGVAVPETRTVFLHVVAFF